MTDHIAPILIVDDKHLIRDIYRQAFTAAGYTVELAATGRDAMEHINTKYYGAILLDVMMPDMDGLSFLSELAQHPSAEYQGPVVLLTNLDPSEVETLEDEFKSQLDAEHQPVRIAGHVVKSKLTPEEVVKRVDALVVTRA